MALRVTEVGAVAHEEGTPPPSEDSGSMLWLPTAVVFAAIAIVAARAAGPITDPDTWWHLRLGREFVGGWSLSAPEALSDFAREPWVPTQWLPEMVAARAESFAGLAGVALLAGCAIVVLGFSLWWLCRSQGAPLAAAFATGLALVGVSSVIAPRPQVLSLILLTVFVRAWLRTATDLRARWWLIPLTWLWATVHGFWFVGGAVGFGVALGMALDRRVSYRGALRLATVPAACLLAAALTPAGPRLLLTPFKVSEVSAFITEWAPPDFHELGPAAVALMMAAVVLTAARRGASWVDLSLLCLAVALMLYSARTVAVAAVLLAPLLAAAIHRWIAIGSSLPAQRRERRGATLAALAALLVVATSVWWRPGYEDPFPSEIDSALSALPADSVVFNEYRYGGWLAWKYPNLVHTIDGMTEAYAPEYIQEYVNARNLQPGWQEFFDGNGITHAFLPSDASIAEELESHLGWRVIGEADGYVVLQRRK